jgi:hypothetical protein
VKEDAMGRTSITNGDKRNAYRILVGKPEGKSHYEDEIVDGLIIKLISERLDVWTGLIWLRIGTSGGLL